MANDETMAKDLYDSMTEKINSLSRDQLLELEYLIHGAIDDLEKKELINLKNKAIKALKDYYDAGGSICSQLENFYIDEDDFDDDFYHIHLM